MLILMKHLDIRVDQEYLDYYMRKVKMFLILVCACRPYYGVDLTALHGTAFHGYFSQVCLGCINCKITEHVLHLPLMLTRGLREISCLMTTPVRKQLFQVSCIVVLMFRDRFEP